MIEYFLFIFLGYLIGSLTFAQIIALVVFKKDLRKRGTGYTGASNLVALAGFKWGILAGVLDVLKALVPMILIYKFTGDKTLSMLFGLFTAVGHIYPLYFGFKGGKGGACTIAVLLFTSPKIFLITLLIVLPVFLITRIPVTVYIVSALTYPVLMIIFKTPNFQLLIIIILFIITLLKIKENIISFFKGKEIPIGKGEIGKGD